MVMSQIRLFFSQIFVENVSLKTEIRDVCYL